MGAAVCFVLYVGRRLHYTFYSLHFTLLPVPAGHGVKSSLQVADYFVELDELTKQLPDFLERHSITSKS